MKPAALRAESIVRPHVRHERGCSRDCGSTFVCVKCRHRVAECRRHFFYVRRCVGCAVALLPSKGRA